MTGRLKQIGSRPFWPNKGQQAHKAHNILIKEEKKSNLSLVRDMMKIAAVENVWRRKKPKSREKTKEGRWVR